jgi:para-nitrobenzyl esterase
VPPHVAVSAQLRNAWIRFATTGDAGWPAFHPDHTRTRVFDRETATVAYPEHASYRIWADHFAEPYDFPPR